MDTDRVKTYQQWLQSHRSEVSAWSCVSLLLTARPCQKQEALPLPLSRGNHSTGLTGQYTKAACYQQEIHLAQERIFCQAREAKGLYVQSDQCQTRRTSAGGTACRGGMWGSVLSFTGQEQAIISAQTTLRNLTLSSQTVSLCLGGQQPCSSSLCFQFSRCVQHHFDVLPLINTVKWATQTLGTACEYKANNPHGTNPAGRAKAKHFASTGQRNFVFCKLSEQIPFKPAVLQRLPHFNTIWLYNFKATNVILIGIKSSFKEKKHRIFLFYFFKSYMRCKLITCSQKANLRHQSDPSIKKWWISNTS